MRITTILLLVAVVWVPVYAAIKTESITYQEGDTTLNGYLAYDDSLEGPRPGVLVVHEWWGHNNYARERARKLAEAGYTAFAVDMYGDGKRAEHPDQAGEFSSVVMQNMDLGRARFMAALALLREHSTTDPEQVAAIGYCFGGGVVLQMARFGVDVKGVVSFHGSLSTSQPSEPGAIKAKILVCHGAEDAFIPQEQVDQFIAEMQSAQAYLQFISYPGAPHSFTNPEADAYNQKFDIPVGYNAEADAQSWADMLRFFEGLFEE